MNIKLDYIKGTITGIRISRTEKRIHIKNEQEDIYLSCKEYDELSNFISSQYGCIEYCVGKEVTVVCDDERALVLMKNQSSMVFINDIILKDGEYISRNANTEYIKEKYNLTKEDLINIIKEESMVKVLKKN